MSKMTDFNLAVETAIIDALGAKKGEPLEAVLAYAHELVKDEYPWVTETLVKKTYEDIMYD